MEREANLNYDVNRQLEDTSQVLMMKVPFLAQESQISQEKLTSNLSINRQDDRCYTSSDISISWGVSSSKKMFSKSYECLSKETSFSEPSRLRGASDRVCVKVRDISPESPKGLNSDIKTIYSEKYKYVGQVNSSEKRHGFGICYYKNGDKYSGQFSIDKKEGYGSFFNKALGKTFNGEFKNNTINGFVEYINRNQSIQLGIMKNLKFIDQGAIIVHQNMFDFEGVIEYIPKEQKTYGIARMKYKNGSVYEGETVDNHEWGWGILHRADGYIIRGEKSEGKYNGYCEIAYPDGSNYYGWCVNSQQSGIGITITSKGEYTIGNYINDLKDGGFLVCMKGYTRFELYMQGFLTKIIENKEAIINYITLVYPEYIWLCKTNNQLLADFLIKILVD